MVFYRRDGVFKSDFSGLVNYAYPIRDFARDEFVKGELNIG
jgi:hypothetical protein